MTATEPTPEGGPGPGEADGPDRELAALLAAGDAAHPFRGRRRWVVGAAGALAVLAALALLRGAGGPAGPRYATAEVTRGPLVLTVTATGSLEPTNQVDVGSELSGIVAAVLVEENDHVERGEVLARLDTSKLETAVARSRAALASARADLAQAKATRGEEEASLAHLQEVERLSGGKVPSRTELEAGRAAAARAAAEEAAARAAVDEARAGLRSDETDLSKASIRSPIDGVVLTRSVEPGQTVAASLQAPVLFTLAENLAQMELHVAVDEADVGKVREGQPATFTVDAYPERRYPAHIERIAYGSQITDNVVTYLTVLDVANDDLSLRPGMTATAEIQADAREDALRIPNAALRFAPPAASAETDEGSRGLVDLLIPHRHRRNGARVSEPEPTAGTERRVWVLGDDGLEPVSVRIGLTDGVHSEVTAGDLAPGMRVVTDVLDAPS